MSLIPPKTDKPSLRVTTLTEDVGPVKVNRQLRELFRDAFDQLGGVNFLVDFALESEANRRVFVQAISKLLPASAQDTKNEKIVIDIPWLVSDRLAYKRADQNPVDADVVDLLPVRKHESNG